MNIRILGWEYTNIRRINNLLIDLTKSSSTPYKISLIMMPNGTGKTTTINLMRAVLDGSAVSWDKDKVLEFKPQHGYINNGIFRLIIKINDNIFHLLLCLDYENGRATYKTSQTGLGGLVDGLIYPYQLSGVFNQQFVSRFVFDGEQAKKTLSSDNDEAEKAITYLYQINELDNLKNKIDLIVKQTQENNTRGMTKQSLSYAKTQMEKKHKILLGLEKKKTSLEKRRIELTAKKEGYIERISNIISSDSKLKEDKMKLDNDKIETNGYIRQNISNILNKMREPFNVHECFDYRMKILSDKMQKLKLPKTMSKEFFNELANSANCICGHSIGEEEKKHILDNAANFLGEDQLVALNAIKDKLKNYVVSDEFNSEIENLNENVRKLEDIDAGLTRLSIQLREQGNVEIDNLNNELDALENQLTEDNKEYKILTNTDKSSSQINDENNIKLADIAYKQSQENYNKATNTFSLYQRAEKIKIYLDNIRDSALKKLKIRILNKTNSKISNIIKSEKIMIERIDGNLVLRNRKAVSEGQTLAIAYSYIGSLFEESSYRFPFIIDSPALSLDLSVRKEISEILPALFEQLIIFVISSEVLNFADSFYNLQDVAFYTIEAKDSSEDATCTLGKDYFNSFQKDELGG
jgi:DNA sulfur modification protein DndD